MSRRRSPRKSLVARVGTVTEENLVILDFGHKRLHRCEQNQLLRLLGGSNARVAVLPLRRKRSRKRSDPIWLGEA